MRKNWNTLVTPMAPILPPYVVVACPHPIAPPKILHRPSIAIPLLTPCVGGGGTLQILAHA